MHKSKPQPKKLPGKNPTDPILLAHAVVEAAIGEPLTPKKPIKNKSSKRLKR